MKRQSLYFLEPQRVEVREESLAAPGLGQVLVQTLLSAVSSGTELLIYRGQAPAEMPVDESIVALPGKFTFPLKYGYAAVGRVKALGPKVVQYWQDKLVFAFQPHESFFLAAPEELWLVPGDLTPEDAVFLANMETAITLALDGQPLLGEQVAIFGQGVVGLLLTALLSRLPLASLVTLDLYPRRRLASESLGADTSLDPQAPEDMKQLLTWLKGSRHHSGADLIYELSGNPAALDQAIAATGYHGRVVVGSWYGLKKVDLHLGVEFHRQRLKLISSQVSRLAPELSGRFNKSRVLELAWQMLRNIKPSRLITQRFPLTQAPQAYQLIDQNPGETLQVVLTY